MRNEQRQLDVLLGNAMVLLVEQQPLFFRILRNIPKIWTANLKGLSGIGIDVNYGQVCILLNSKKLYNGKPFELKIILEHLLHHLLLGHLNSRKGEETWSLHLATDFIINQSISDIEHALWQVGKLGTFTDIGHPKFLKHIHGMDVKTLAETSSLELAYLISRDTVRNWKSIDTIDDHEIYAIDGRYNLRSISNDTSFNNLIDERMKEAVRVAAKDLNYDKSKYGNIPASLEMVITAISGKSEVDYGKEMRRFSGNVAANSARTTWSRPNRRYGFHSPGRSTEYIGKMVIILDASGSMWAKSTFEKFVLELNSLSETCRDLWLIVGDTQESLRKNVSGKSISSDALKITGGGGTDLQFGFNAAKEMHADGILVFTDGWIPNFNNYGIPTLILLTPGGSSISGYRNIKLTA